MIFSTLVGYIRGMKKCKLIIEDQVNIRFADIDANLRRSISETLKFLVPYARHTPQFKLGRWDGKVAFATIGGQTYFNLLDRVLPLVIGAGYEIDVEDKRPQVKFQFPEIDEEYLADTVWPDGHPMEGEPIMLREHQVKAVNAYTANLQSVQSISTSAGKAQPLYSKILTPHGWKTMADMKVGEQVIAADGSVANVIGVYPQGKKPIFEIALEDGLRTHACAEHLWAVEGGEIISTEEMMNRSWISIPVYGRGYADVVSITEVGIDDAQCIMIDHPDHLYVTDDYIVTHNTIITGCLSKMVEPYGRSLVIVPGKDLVLQTCIDYVNIGLDTGRYFGDHKETGHKHTIATWQSLTALAKNKPDVLKEILDDCVAVIVDEAHSIKGQELKNLLTRELAHIPIRWALTGTVPKEDFEYLALLSSIGPKVGEISAKELMDKGILSNCHIHIKQTVDDVTYSDFAGEKNYLSSDPLRVEWIIDFARNVALNGNTMLLVNNIDLGKEISEALDVPFIYGNIKSKDRAEEYKGINTTDNQLIVATFGVASTGINIPRLFNVVIIEAGKSYVRVIQSIGRGLRRAKDKNFVNIYDICSTAKYSKRHLTERKKFYRDAEYAHSVEKIKYR